MVAGLKIIEAMGTINQYRNITLDQPVPIGSLTRVKVIILTVEEDLDEIDEQEWLRAASRNPAFDFLNDPEENIYTLEDGVPFYDAG